MSYKSIGITGSKGVLGSYIKKKLKNVKFDCFNGDITNKRDIQKWLKGKKFDALFHFAAVVPTKKVLNSQPPNSATISQIHFTNWAKPIPEIKNTEK